MSELNEVIFVVVLVVTASLLVLLPAILANVRRLQQRPYRSVAALNALVLLAGICSGAEPLILWVAAVSWLAALAMALLCRSKDDHSDQGSPAAR